MSQAWYIFLILLRFVFSRVKDYTASKWFSYRGSPRGHGIRGLGDKLIQFELLTDAERMWEEERNGQGRRGKYVGEGRSERKGQTKP